MKVLLIGSTGNLGHVVKNKLREHGHTVFSPAREELDASNAVQLEHYSRDKNPDFIINCAGHLAASTSARNRGADALFSNLRISLALHETSSRLGIFLVDIGSSVMYGSDSKTPFRESDFLSEIAKDANEGYAYSKQLSAQLAFARGSLNPGLSVVLVLSNLSGPSIKPFKQNPHLPLAAIIKVMEASKEGRRKIEVVGSLATKREYTSTQDISEFLASNLNDAPDWPILLNLGSGNEVTVGEVYSKAQEVVGWEVELVSKEEDLTGPQSRLMDSSIARKLGWSPKTSLREDLTSLYESMRNENF